jgi:site-specific DNA-methyltransferase (adenine-specific)
MTPYYSNGVITIYCGGLREILPKLGKFDAIITDPPYASTSLSWDRWPDGWPSVCLEAANSLWCFGTFRMFWDKRDEFVNWRIAQDLVWEKQNSTSPTKGRFRNVHELVIQFYQGLWRDIYANPVYRFDATKRSVRRKKRPPHWGYIENSAYESQDGGPRLERSVIQCRNCHGKAVFPTQKPVEFLKKLIQYSIPPGGCLVDPMCGSGSTLVAAYELGVKAVGIDISEECCELAVGRIRS